MYNLRSDKWHLETERLYLYPLSSRELLLWVDDLPALEQELDCQYKAEPMEGIFQGIVRSQCTITQEDPEHYLFHTFWFLIQKEDGIVIGSADFKDLPNEKGEVEIGYGLGKEFEHHGYMSEAVEALCAWGLDQEEIKAITAETDPDGWASQRILKRCGFSKYPEKNPCWWILSKAGK
ncbi:MAG: GNAT family N-acetyltransferase [Planctomycetia bacterium]|nr:GNAT family N-acetyltransferase [Planctomycetia bacterium]